MKKEEEKTCFVIMPISDNAPYDNGHFFRVYEYIIKPAILEAGFVPLRADEVKSTNYIAIDILKRIINSDMAICDLSSKNPNVLYELGIRQAFNLPVTFIKDSITDRVFDIQGFRDLEYDEKMRVDNVKLNIQNIADLLKNTYESKDSDEVNSLVSLLGIESAKIVSKEISSDTELIIAHLESLGERMETIESQIINKKKSIYPDLNRSFSDYIDDIKASQLINIKDVVKGTKVYHEKFGNGIVISLEGTIHSRIATINFINEGEKKLMLSHAKLYSVEH